MTDNTLVLVASNLRPMDAEMMRLHLESLGIEVFIQNQMVFSAREADLGGGAASLLVRADQAEQAVEALQSDEVASERQADFEITDARGAGPEPSTA